MAAPPEGWPQGEAIDWESSLRLLAEAQSQEQQAQQPQQQPPSPNGGGGSQLNGGADGGGVAVDAPPSNETRPQQRTVPLVIETPDPPATDLVVICQVSLGLRAS